MGGLTNLFTQAVKVGHIDRHGRGGTGPGQEFFTQLQPILILTDQLPHLFAAGAVAALADLRIHKSFQGFGQGNVHGAHSLVRNPEKFSGTMLIFESISNLLAPGILMA